MSENPRYQNQSRFRGCSMTLGECQRFVDVLREFLGLDPMPWGGLRVRGAAKRSVERSRRGGQ